MKLTEYGDPACVAQCTLDLFTSKPNRWRLPLPLSSTQRPIQRGFPVSMAVMEDVPPELANHELGSDRNKDDPIYYLPNGYVELTGVMTSTKTQQYSVGK